MIFVDEAVCCQPTGALRRQAARLADAYGLISKDLAEGLADRFFCFSRLGYLDPSPWGTRVSENLPCLRRSRLHDSPNRVAVVTGGGRGIGRGIVLELACLGFSVVVNYRSDAASARESCQQAESLGAPRALEFQADVADVQQGRRLLDHVLANFGRIDIWVNNAGVAPSSRLDLLETTSESWDRVLDTNLRGPFFLTQAVAIRPAPAHGIGDRRRASNRLHQLDLEHFRKRQSRRVLRCQGGSEHGGPALRGTLGRAGRPRL